MGMIIERALELVPTDSRIGLGSGRAARAFVKALGERNDFHLIEERRRGQAND